MWPLVGLKLVLALGSGVITVEYGIIRFGGLQFESGVCIKRLCACVMNCGRYIPGLDACVMNCGKYISGPGACVRNYGRYIPGLGACCANRC